MRWLRLAEGYLTQTAFAARLGWPHAAVNQFEQGTRRVPADRALQIRRIIPGFDPLWLWTGEKQGLSFDLRRRIEVQEALENPNGSCLTGG